MFFRDRSNVFFSLLSVIIIIALYALFLGNVMESNLANIPSLTEEYADKLAVISGGIILSGMVAVTSITAAQGSLGCAAVADKMGAAKDFVTSPVKRRRLVASYIVGSAACSGIMSALSLVLTVGYLLIVGGKFPSGAQWGQIALTMVLTVMCANAFVYFLSTFINTSSAFVSFSTVMGTLIGFLMGIYIPIGSLPDAVGWVIKCFPLSHAASMYKIAIVGEELNAAFSNPAVVDSLNLEMGVTYSFGQYTTDFWFSAAVLVVFTVIFFGLALLRGKKKRKGAAI
jgi:multidrug/hemolysin transport system permease protein